MRRKSISQSGLFNPRSLIAFALSSAGILLAMLSVVARPAIQPNSASRASGNSFAPAKIFNDHATGPMSDRSFGQQRSGRLPRVSASPWLPTHGPPLAPSDAGWSIVPSPNALVEQVLYGVSCVSASDCWAVGFYETADAIYQTLVEHWNGTSWSIVASPNAGAGDNHLADVACVSASDCWAVGSPDLIEHWNGTSWSIVTSPPGYLSGVTCSSASDCWAVGSVLEHWNGTSWSIVASPNVGELADVACISASNCWAVGSYYNNPAEQTLVEHWNGTSWLIVASPNTSATQDNYLNSVTCGSASDCWAVGNYANASLAYQTLIEHWNGTSWSIVTSPNISTTDNNALYGVTCVSPSDCSAVGYHDNGTVSETLIQRWNGISWSIVASPNTGVDNYNFLFDITCTSASTCWAVGESDGTLVERWNGSSWSIVGSPSVSAIENYLSAITCVSASDCWAVGYYQTEGFFGPLIEHWNGTSWSVVSSPSAALENYLSDVTCTSPSDCWAVGYYSGDQAYQTLVEHWNGSSWSIIVSPNTSDTQSNFLSGVTCVSSSDCWGVGRYATGQAALTLTEHWNGSAWTIVGSPNTSGQTNNLDAVNCVSASDCWTVGEYYNGTTYQTLIEHWNGSSWFIVASPSITQDNEFHDIACISASACWAVGYYLNGTAYQTLIERWNGTSWSIVTSPNVANSQENNLNSVTCASASDCWSIGYYTDDNGFYQTLTEHWNGTSWSVVNSPNANPMHDNYLSGVACVSGSNCWTVGFFTPDGVGYQTLILHYTATTPQVTSAVSRKTHGAAGQFDIDLPVTGIAGVECRSGGGTNDFTMVVTFASNVTVTGNPQAQVTSGTGTIGNGGVSNGGVVTVAGSVVTIPLTNVTDQQTINVTLNGVNSALDATATNVVIPMSRLLGDTTGNRTVNAGDVIQTKGRLGQVLTTANFRSDVNVSGGISAGDVTQVKANSGHGVP